MKDVARQESEGRPTLGGRAHYDDSSEVRWSRHPEIQGDPAPNFWAKTGWSPEDLQGKLVLDFGCGNGANALVAAEHTETVWALDSSPAAYRAARDNIEAAGKVGTVSLALARSLTETRCEESGELWFEDETFDLVYALGSLHTTPDPRAAFAEAARHVRVGGELAVWVQCKPVTHDALLVMLGFLHDITRGVPPETLYRIIREHAPRVRDVYQGSWGALQQILRVFNDADDETCISSTFDWRAARHRSWHGHLEMVSWFEEEGFDIIWTGGFPETLRGRRSERKSATGACRERKLEAARERRERREKTGKPKVLLVSDVHGWAFDQNFHDLEEALSDRFDFDHGYVWDWTVDESEPFPDFEQYDVIFLPYHRWGIEDRLPMERTVGALRAQWIFPENKSRPGRREIELVNSYAAYQVVTRASYENLAESCPRVVLLTNPVNMQRFPEPTQARDEVIATWNGNAGHTNLLKEDVKGFRSIVVPACRRARVLLEYAEYNINRLAPHEMPGFYQLGNVALCASLYEGASSSVMEAMAAGLAVIATDVGNHREMHENMLHREGASGIMLVERSVEAFTKALRVLKADPERVRRMGAFNREEIELNWSWDVWKDAFADFLMIPMRRQEKK